MQISLDEKTHTYKDAEGNKIPSVSAILAESGVSDFSFVPKDVLERSQKFGTAFHKATELLETGKLKSYDPQMEPWIEAFRRWTALAKPSWKIMEKYLGSSTWKFAGMPDRFGDFSKHEGSLLDLKTGVPSPAHAIQTAAYQILIEENLKVKVKRRFTLYVSAEEYKMVEHKDKNDKNVFISMLFLYNWKKSKGLLNAKH